MAGLLDFVQSPEGQGLLSAAFGGMASARRGSGPINFIGNAGVAGLQGYGNAIHNNQVNALGELQLEDAQRKSNTQKAMMQAAKDSQLTPEQVSLVGGGGPTIANAAKIATSEPQFDTKGFLNRMWAVDPLQALQVQQGLAKESPFAKVDAKDFTPESVAKFAQTRNFGDLTPARKMEVAPGGQVYNPFAIQPGQVLADPNKPFSVGADGTPAPNTQFQQYQLDKAKAGAARTRVSIGNIGTQESEQSKAYGKTLGDIRSGITSSAFEAPSTMAKLDRLEGLLSDAGTGTNAGLKLAQAANAFGLKVDPKLGEKEAAASLTRELASSLRKPGTGAMTDADFENFMQQVPGLSQSEAGRAQIIKTMRAKAARDIEIGKLARTYAAKNGGVIDDGFMDVVSDYVAKNPVVQRPSTSGRPNVFPDASAIDQELARRQGGR